MPAEGDRVGRGRARRRQLGPRPPDHQVERAGWPSCPAAERHHAGFTALEPSEYDSRAVDLPLSSPALSTSRPADHPAQAHTEPVTDIPHDRRHAAQLGRRRQFTLIDGIPGGKGMPPCAAFASFQRGCDSRSTQVPQSPAR